jgi:hypothetical protein
LHIYVAVLRKSQQLDEIIYHMSNWVCYTPFVPYVIHLNLDKLKYKFREVEEVEKLSNWPTEDKFHEAEEVERLQIGQLKT